jgi:MinD-like ATPase involved in chromosome partitioning or flagellar assembly
MICTFYSYKGGVGRSMALVNVAEVFYRAGYKVLMVDWDLEAPGLERFFPEELENLLDEPGIIELLMGYKKQMTEEWSATACATLPFTRPNEFITDVYPGASASGRLWLLTAGRRSVEHFSEYANAVLSFDWIDFFRKWGGAGYFEWLRQEFESIADIVLVDSRTGVTEMGGVCTYQLADVVVVFCGTNQQSIEGAYQIAQNFRNPEIQELRNGRPLHVLAVPSRVEMSAEADRLDEFKEKFLRLFRDIVKTEGINVELLWQMKIPYIAKYAFEEAVAVRRSDKASAEDMSEAYVSLARAMERLAGTEAMRRLVAVLSEDGGYAEDSEGISRPLPQFDLRHLDLVDPTQVVKLSDNLYIRREADDELERQVDCTGSITTIRAPRQTGKSSLLVRGIHRARQARARVVLLDLQLVDSAHLKSPDSFLHHLAESILLRLKLDMGQLKRFWDQRLAPPIKLTTLMEEYALSASEDRLVLAMDEVDRLLDTPFHNDFFGMLRAWCNRAAYEQPWDRLSIVMAIATDPWLFIQDVRQSPFNVGLQLKLEDFNQLQVWDLNQRHGNPVSDKEISRLMELLGGHPYLTRQGLYTLVHDRLTWSELESMAASDEGPFGEHLRHYYRLVQQSPNQREALKQIIRRNRCSDTDTFYRLEQAGLVRGIATACQCRCDLYRRYFQDKLQ